tara:strand:+ start:1739 stop:3208 length:1470 start_codon:yes stop_codon:yes gene_type:complete
MAITAEPPTLDWSLATDNVSFDILTNLMEGLAQYNEKLEPVPAVAARWEFSRDKKTITFFLRDDVFWSDGKSVTAEDFEYSWKRLLNPVTAAEYAYFLFDVENAYEYNSGKIIDESRLGIRALSPTILQVKLKRPAVYFPSIVTFMATFPQRRDLVERHGDLWTDPENLVTNGPFLLKDWKHEYKLVMKANSGYYGKIPDLKKVIAYIVEEATTGLTLYETGELDVVELPPVSILRYRKHPEYRNLPLLRGYYYGFNVDQKPFDDPKVRRSLAHAINRSSIPHILKGGELPVSSWIPRGMFGFNPDLGSKFDPEQARHLLAEAGYPDGQGFPLAKVVYNTDQTNRLIAEFIQAQWKTHLNIKIELESQEWKVFLSRLKTDPPQIFRLGWGADFPDPENFMNLFVSTSGNNHLHWSNARYDSLVAEGAKERDPVKRKKIYDKAQKILTETEAVIVPLFVAVQNIMVKPHVKGFFPNAMELMYLKNVRLEN